MLSEDPSLWRVIANRCVQSTQSLREMNSSGIRNLPSNGRERLDEAQKSWRFTYEALTHVNSLRLFLCNGSIPVPWRFASLHAKLASESPISSSPVVLCEWIRSEGDSRRLFVPLPVCLVDYSAPLSVVGRSDHIEIKLKLLSSGGSFADDLKLLGYSYRGEPIGRDGGVKSNSLKRDTFFLPSDTELLASKQEVTFYCRSCSVKLTKQPMSCFRALPSTEWRELADHWFGMCCCSDGVKTKSMMARFEEFTTPASGVCLVGSTTCIIHVDDLGRNIVDHNQLICVDEEVQSIPIMTGNDGETHAGHDLDGEVSCKEGSDGCVALSTNLQSSVDESKPFTDLAMKSKGYAHHAVEELTEPATCCNGHETAVVDDCGTENIPHHAVKAKSLANGFMSAFPSTALTPLNCSNCDGLIGVFSGRKEEGVQLFKCHISSDIPTGGPVDTFRSHTLERVFSNELFCNAEEDSSYRFAIRDLNSRLPLLRLVLMNHESWICSGVSIEEQRLYSDLERTKSVVREESSIVTGQEDDINSSFSHQDVGLMSCSGNEKLGPVFLEPVMKVMFSDSSSFRGEQLSDVESWGQKNQSDDIYMLGSEVRALAKALEANRKLFPESCAAFEQFHFSFLAR